MAPIDLDHLPADVDHILAVAAFDRRSVFEHRTEIGPSPPRTRHSPSGDPLHHEPARWDAAPTEAGLTALDEAMHQLANARRQFRLDIDSDLAAVGADGSSVLELEGWERRGSGSTGAACRLFGLLALGEVHAGGNAFRAGGLAQRALVGGRLLDEGVGSPALLAAGMALGAAGHTHAAESLFGVVAERGHRAGSHAAVTAGHGLRGVERYRGGGLDGALADLEAALSMARGQPWEAIVDDSRACLLRVRIERDDLTLAEQDLHAWRATGPLPDTPFGNRLLIERGRLRLVEGRLADAMVDLEAAARRLAGNGDSVLFEWRGAAALGHHHLGEHEAALELAREDVGRAAVWGAPRQLGTAMTTLGLIEGGAQGIERIRQASVLLDRSPALLERARALVSLGLLLRRAGEPGRARAKLAAGIQLATPCGARALVALAEQEIAASGRTRRRRTLLSGPEALTPTEGRIARLAASGLSNPDIARALYITRKTVEMHLGNAYRKLQINSRQQLNAALNHKSQGARAET